MNKCPVFLNPHKVDIVCTSTLFNSKNQYEMNIQINEHQPVTELRAYVETYWTGSFNLDKEPELYQNVVPNGFVELILHTSDRHCNLKADEKWATSPDYTIIGLYTQPYIVQFTDLVHVFGIRFKPEGIFNLFGIPASVFNEGYEDMEHVLGRDFREFCNRIREVNSLNQKLEFSNRYLLNQLRKNHPEMNYVNRAAEMIRKADEIEKIEDLPGKVYISLRQLEREFKNKVGTTPKRYMRIARINDVYRRLENGEVIDYTKLAFECGYADQAHFIRDFKTFTGIKPSFYHKNRAQLIVNPQMV